MFGDPEEGNLKKNKASARDTNKQYKYCWIPFPFFCLMNNQASLSNGVVIDYLVMDSQFGAFFSHLIYSRKG